MKKKNYCTWKMQLLPEQAKPGQKLAFLGKNAMKFCQEFNQKTKEMESGKIVNVRIIVRENTYQFFIEGLVTSDLIKKKLGEKKTISEEEIGEIAQELDHLSTEDIEKKKKIVAGTVRSFGVKING
jgi:large subunit ribosomal protein L11